MMTQENVKVLITIIIMCCFICFLGYVFFSPNKYVASYNNGKLLKVLEVGKINMYSDSLSVPERITLLDQKNKQIIIKNDTLYVYYVTDWEMGSTLTKKLLEFFNRADQFR